MRRRRLLADTPGDVLCFLPGVFEIHQAIVECGRSSTRAGRGAAAVRRARRGRPGSGDSRLGRRDAAHRRRHQRRRNVADGPRRDGGCRFGAAQSREVRRVRARSTASITERISAGFGRPASGPRRPNRARAASGGCGMRAIACGRAPTPRFAGWTCAPRCSTSWPGEATLERSSGTSVRRRRRIDAVPGAARPPRRRSRGRADRPRTGHRPIAAAPSPRLHAPRGRRRPADGPRLRAAVRASGGAVENGCRDQLRSAVGARLLGRPAAARRPRRARAGAHLSVRRSGRAPADDQRGRRSAERSSPAIPIESRSGASRDRARVKLATGTGAVLGQESGVRDGEFLVAVDVRAQPGDARIGMASLIDRDWLQPNGIEIVHTFDAGAGVVRALERERYDALILREQPGLARSGRGGAVAGRRMVVADAERRRRAVAAADAVCRPRAGCRRRGARCR